MIEIADVERVANIAKIAMTDEQKKAMTQSLGNTLDFIDELEKINTDGIDAATFMVANRYVLRDDVAGVEFSQVEALQNAPNAKKGHFAIPKVLG